jgi:hypothetical protein
MNDLNATAEFSQQLEKLIDYFSMEFDMSMAQVLGVLEVAKFNVIMQQLAGDVEDDQCGDYADD